MSLEVLAGIKYCNSLFAILFWNTDNILMCCYEQIFKGKQNPDLTVEKLCEIGDKNLKLLSA